ncbi:hypothetical protein TL08_09665 [Actinoalloteichus hymeniacidonis]|uniref:DUF4440 domain-containing protein n=2 Tax=Actinoalloteichus hymeniacidonis TaxID=340345 RepID=A0AAC9HNY3_9PSEU|nr:hypothetical protein TL08_09665 [Actinoalloteichus hymeniacidonis]
MNALFDDDPIFVNIVGNLVLDRETLLRAQAFVFDGPLREVYVRYDVESLIFLHTDIAVVHARQRPAAADGALLPVDTENRESIVVFVAVRTSAGWRIRVGQNTVVG